LQEGLKLVLWVQASISIGGVKLVLWVQASITIAGGVKASFMGPSFNNHWRRIQWLLKLAPIKLALPPPPMVIEAWTHKTSFNPSCNGY
jgi:hypothetical protein